MAISKDLERTQKNRFEMQNTEIDFGSEFGNSSKMPSLDEEAQNKIDNKWDKFKNTSVYSNPYYAKPKDRYAKYR